MRHSVRATPAAMLLTLAGIGALLWYASRHGLDRLALMTAGIAASAAALLAQKLRFGHAAGARFDAITVAIAWAVLFVALIFTPFA